MKTRILILDDSEELLDALNIFLHHASFIVCTAGNKKIFESKLENFKPDIIILDVYLKEGEDGRKICRDLKNNTETKHVPIILMSARESVLKNYEDCSADAVLQKPFNLIKLIQIIDSLKTNQHAANF